MNYAAMTVNLCEKINRYAKPNSMVIGGDLYRETEKPSPILKKTIILNRRDSTRLE